MANYATLKAAISQVIKENGNKEITGAVMQTTLLAMVDSMASGYTFAGVATPSTSAGTPDENVFWIGGAGSYSNFGATTINVPTGCICVFTYNGSFASSILYVGGVVDISLLTNTSYASLSQALSDVPAFLQVGGLEIMYQDSASGNYVKYRLMATSWSTTESDWQGVDDVPTAGSDNKVKSGGVNSIIADISCSKILETKNVSAIYTQINQYDGLVVLEVTNTNAIASAILAIATDGYAAAVTQPILTGESLAAGTHRYLLYLNSTERYIRCMSGAVAATGVNIRVCQLTEKTLETVSQEVFSQLTGEIVASYNISAIYTSITPTSDTRIYEVTLSNDIDNLHISLNTSGSASGDTIVIVGDRPMKAGTYFFPVKGNVDNKYIRCYSNGTSVYPTGVSIKIYKTLQKTFLLPTPEQIGAVNQYQGEANSGKVLVIGADGRVVPGYVTPQGTIEVSGLAQQNNRTLNLGENLLEDNAQLSGFTGNLNDGYTLSAGNTGTITFPYITTLGKRYVAIFTVNRAIDNLFVSIGDCTPVDTYRDAGELVVGFISQGGTLLINKTILSGYDTIITNVELREIVSEEDAVIQKTILVQNVDFWNRGISDFWNIAIGPNDTFAAIQNGSRNIAIGKSAMQAFISGTRNIAVGTFALAGLKEGDYNISIGSDSNYMTRKGNGNVTIGMGALGDNVVLLNGEPHYGDANENVAIGHNAMGGCGKNEAGTDLETPEGSVAVGYRAGFKANKRSVSIGYGADSQGYGVDNVTIGHNANYNGHGSGNVVIGKAATCYNHSNVICLGKGSYNDKDNQAVLGSSTITETKLFGNIVNRGLDGVVRKIVFNNDNSVTWETIS